jgi:glycosyl hydrolase family 79
VRSRHAARTGALAVSLALACALAPAVAASRRAPRPTATVGLARSKVVATVSPRYVSFAVDIDQVVGATFWSQAPGATGKVPVAPYDFSRPQLQSLAAALAPAYLRISGTGADATYYDLSGGPPAKPPPGYSRTLTRSQWDAANRFAERLGLQIAFGVNDGPGPRDAAGAWTGENARALLQYTAASRYPLGALELGNEPNLLAETAGMPAGYDAAAYARDLQQLRALRDGIVPGALLVGPGAFTENAGDEYFGAPLGPLTAEILPLAGGAFDALSWHEYAARSSRCPSGSGAPVPSEPLAPAYLDGILNSYVRLRSLGEAAAPGRPLWLDESGSAYCGGQPGYSDRWAATFWYLNALGQLAQRGVQVFVRQTLSGSDYGLIDEATLRPNPDYWAALLWHRLMGTRILRARTAHLPARVRAFAACSPSGRGATLLALNLDPRHPHRLLLSGPRRRRSVYLATAPELLGSTVLLNGRPLEVLGGRLPRLSARPTRSRRLTLPPASYVFVHEARGPAACRGA